MLIRTMLNRATPRPDFTRRMSAVAAVAVAAAITITAIGGAHPVANASLPPERSLMGVRIFDKFSVVIKKFGNPTKIITGSVAPSGASASTTATGTAPSGTLPPMPTPGSPGASTPEFGGSGGSTGGTTGGGISSSIPNSVVYQYITKAGMSMEFTLSQAGQVIQIMVASQGRNSNVKTARGVTLGTPYSAVLTKYGFPESQETQGSILTAKYTDRAHVAFQFYQNKVVSITVAAVE